MIGKISVTLTAPFGFASGFASISLPLPEAPGACATRPVARWR